MVKPQNVIKFITQEELRNRTERYHVCGENAIKGYFYDTLEGRSIKSTTYFVQITYIEKYGYFILEAMHPKADTMPSQYITEDTELLVFYNYKTYTMENLRELYIMFNNYSTIRVIDSLPG